MGKLQGAVGLVEGWHMNKGRAGLVNVQRGEVYEVAEVPMIYNYMVGILYVFSKKCDLFEHMRI